MAKTRSVKRLTEDDLRRIRADVTDGQSSANIAARHHLSVDDAAKIIQQTQRELAALARTQRVERRSKRP